MGWQCILGIVLMVAGFAGVLVCAKIQKTNPSIQPVAMLCAVVMLIGLGVYFWFYLNPVNYDAEYAQIYSRSVVHTIGKDSNLQGKKVIWFGSGVDSEQFQSRVAAFTAASGITPQIIETSDPQGEMMDGAGFKAKLQGAGADTVVIIDCDVNYFADELISQLRARNGASFVFTDGASSMLGAVFSGRKQAQLAAAFNSGRIILAVVSDKNEEGFTPDEDELDEAFSKRYTIINKDNFNSEKIKLGME